MMQNEKLRIPVIVGITGHRDLVVDETVKEQLHLFFRQLKNALPETPVYLMSGLAAGADQLATEIGLEELGEQGKTYAVLAFSRQEFEKDFDDQNELKTYRSLLEQAAAIKEFSANMEHIEKSYADVGNFIVEHANILLALWDGNQVYDDAAMTQVQAGGTGDVCGCWLNRSAKDPNRLFCASDANTLVRIPVKRRKIRPNEKPFPADAGIIDFSKFTVKDHFLKFCFSDRDWSIALHNIDRYNKISSNGLNESAKTSKSYLGLNQPQGLLDTLADRFSVMDSYASHNQKFFENNLSILLMLSLFVGFFSVVYGGLNHAYFSFTIGKVTLSLIEFTLPLYLITYVCMLCYYFFSKKKELTCQYLDFRAFAEILRVQIYWKIAGIVTKVSSCVLTKDADNCEWISIALKNWELLDSHEPVSSNVDIRKVWIEDQIKYYGKTADKLEKRLKISNGIGLFFYLLSFVVAAVFLVITIHDKCTGVEGETILLGDDFWLGFGPLIFAILGFLAEKKGWEDTSASYRNSKKAFEHVLNCLRSTQDPEQQKNCIEFLGREALSEHENWLKLYRTKQPEPNL